MPAVLRVGCESTTKRLLERITSAQSPLLPVHEDPTHLKALRDNPGLIFKYGQMTADEWQLDLLKDDSKKLMVCCSRQTGKSQTAAGKALLKALLDPPATILIVSKAQRQAAELMRKVKDLYRGYRGERVYRRSFQPKKLSLDTSIATLDRYIPNGSVDDEKPLQDSVHSIEMRNGSRIICLPGSADTIVGYSAIDLLIIDEASRTPDELYSALSPMRAVSQGQFLVLSTPFGKRGWFWEEWKRCVDRLEKGEKEPWKRYQVKVYQCPRITKEWLEEEKESVGNRWFRQEYECSFEDTVDSVFAYEDIHAMLNPAVTPFDW